MQRLSGQSEVFRRLRPNRVFLSPRHIDMRALDFVGVSLMNSPDISPTSVCNDRSRFHGVATANGKDDTSQKMRYERSEFF
jgi:hypothetical protein